MSVRLPSASKVGLHLRCAFPGSPHAPSEPLEVPSMSADRGVDVHALAEAIVDGREHACSPEIEAYRAPLADAVATLRAEGWHLSAEVSMAYAPATGSARALPKGKHRDYSDVGPHEIPGTADIVGIKPGRLLIADVKTGRGAKQHAATETEQLHTLAVGFAAIYSPDVVEVALIHVEPGDYEIDRGDLYAWDLEEVADRLRALAATTDPMPTPGPHCTGMYCPIRAVCPATVAAVAAIDRAAVEHFPADSIGSAIVRETYTENGEDRVRLTLRDEETARRARIALKLYDDRSKMLRDALHNFVRRGAIEVSPGVFYGFVENARETVGDLTPEAVELIRSTVGEEALSFSSSGDAIERAAKAKQTKRGEGKRKADEVKAELRRMGVMRRSAFQKPQEFTRSDNDTNDSEESAA